MPSAESPAPATTPPSPRADVIVGIDLGTTNSLVAICDARGPRILPDEHGHPLLPSVVRYEPAPDAPASPGVPAGLRAVVGREARDQAHLHPRTTIASVKRLMGRSLRDATPDLAYLSYEVVEGEHGQCRVRVPMGQTAGAGQSSANQTHADIAPQQVSAAVLARLKDQASRALGVDVRRAVVTVPAYFDDAQRQATRDAGRLAGLDVVRIVPEPTAATLAYGLALKAARAKASAEATVAVYDLGGGTFDVSILRLVPGDDGASAHAPDADAATDFYQVLATSGDTHLGGDDIDHALMLHLARAWGLTLDGAAPTLVRTLKAEAERVKIALSDAEFTDARLDGSAPLRVTRAELDALAAPLVERTIDACARALRDARRAAGLEAVPADLNAAAGFIDAVVLVGGATRTPLVRRRVAEFFGLTPYTAIDPDQAVALGAAVQGAILSGAITGALLLDVIPLSLGIETVGGAVAKLIVKNSTVPARAVEMFSTSVDHQTAVAVNVFQGEREMASDCRPLGKFILRGLPPMPAGIPQVEVEFLVDANGVLSVSARERRSGRRASLQVVPNHGLTRDEVDRMEAESITHARQDMQRHRVVDLVVNAKLDLKWIGERLARFGDRLDPAPRAALQARVDALADFVARAERDWESVDANAFHQAKDALDRESVRLQEISISESLKGAKAPGGEALGTGH